MLVLHHMWPGSNPAGLAGVAVPQRIADNEASSMPDTSATTHETPVLAVPPVSQPRHLSPLRRSIMLMKPVTWFAPAWAFLCGAIASGATAWTPQDVGRIALGTFLSGPILCGLSQVINDYYDRDVDAINEPHRLIPSGMVSTRQVFVTIGALAAIALTLTLLIGVQIAVPVVLGLVFAVLYSVDPVRAKRNGWFGNLLVGISYEGLPWLAGNLAFGALTGPSLLMALLFSIGTHGIMIINDFKSVDGDRQSNIRSIPVQLGVWGAGWMAILTIMLAQLFVLLTFVVWGRWWIAGIYAAFVLLQIPAQIKFMKMTDPVQRAIFYNGTGIMLFVWGMLVAAIGVR